MSALKSGMVGRFVSVKGTVARCSAVRPLVLAAKFQCPKCSEWGGLGVVCGWVGGW
jgi:DNA replicative helicase MCM subunit Mcm2 (Cdc46/Mcm family)